MRRIQGRLIQKRRKPNFSLAEGGASAIGRVLDDLPIKWAEADIFRADDNSDKPKFYALEMFPYPSGRIHMGHVRNYAMGDVVARYKKARGFEVLHPMGWDSFGMPAENAAIATDGHPKDWTYNNIDEMRAPLQRLGFALDWSREFATSDVDYYKTQQKIFLKFWEKDLVYRKTARDMDQWFFKITHYAEDLLKGLEGLERWPEKVRTMQANWIGKSEGLQMTFEWEKKSYANLLDMDTFGAVTSDPKDVAVGYFSHLSDGVEVYTTRPDTLYGASFIAVSADHDLIKRIGKYLPNFEAFKKEITKIGTSEEAIAQAPKLGFDTGLRVQHPLEEGETLPVWVANFVLMGYGTGAVFGCPAHDQRDLDFARKYDLPVTPVVLPEGEDAATYAIGSEAYTGEGTLFNSAVFDGLNKSDGISAAIAKISDIGLGYWGCPIPVIKCGDCGSVPVPENQLPVELPYDINFDKPGNPLDRHPTWK